MLRRTLLSVTPLLIGVVGCSDMGNPPVEPIPELTVMGDTINEGEVAECEILLSFAPTKPVTVVYELVGVTATDNVDFVSRVDTIIIEADEHSGHEENHAHLTFPITQDSDPEELEEISVIVTKAVNATIVNGTGSCFIVDDDGAPRISVSDPVVTEGEVATFLVTLNVATTTPVSFNYTTNSGTATVDLDFAAALGSGTIPAGETELAITSSTADDNLSEGTETFTLTVSNLSGAEPLKLTGTCTIGDNEAAPVSFSADIRPIFDNRCIGCHNAAVQNRGFSVATYSDVMTSGDRGPHVAPGHSEHSTLYLVLLSPPPTGFVRMPQGGSLSATEIQKIKDWIDQGALNN